MLSGTATNLTGLGKQLEAGGVDLSWAWSNRTWPSGQKVLGMLLTGILLSLGAPSWYNALRQMASLRPVIAETISFKA